ncbi:winged helix DNA-binding domain-containing protein [Yinghuangia sp. YIM S10712]|uniref:winged helix DNA-binding domain-containing protein n=1 Tax=Yinghuangia sp. YIM S10712 TaxID=3436930 RepID=UPI003F529AFB
MRISVADRRARLAVRHQLAPSCRAKSVEDTAERLVGLHATDSASVVLSSWARSADRDCVTSGLDQALYAQRTLHRMHCMRRTLFVVPTHLAPVLHASTTRDVAARERAGVLKLLAATGPERDAAWLAAAEDAALAALRRLGEAGTLEITAEVPELQQTIVMSPGKRYEAIQRVGSAVLRLLAMDGRVRRSRPIGGWTSGQFRYEVAQEPPDIDPDHARADVVRRWLACYGPGTTDDVKWWTGWPVKDVRKALARIGAREVDLEEGTGWVTPDDADTSDTSDTDADTEEPWAALLPTLDPATMGWKHRDWYVDPALRPQLYDTAGNGGPTVWWNGEIIGAWAQRADGEVVWRLLVDRGTEAREAVRAEAHNLQTWLAHHRYTVRYSTPLTRELTA